MIKMVVSDLDGTLLNSHHEVTEKTKEAIHYLRQLGIHFTIATGRPDQLVKEYVGELDINDPVIMYNGSVIGHPFQKERILEHVLPKDRVNEIFEFCEQEEIICMPYTKEMIISRPNYRVDYFLERNQSLPEAYQAIFKDIRDVKDIVSLPIHKILLIENDELKHRRITDKFSKYHDMTVVSSQKGFIDINPIGVNKGVALEQLAKHHNVSLDDVLVFGDQDNDVSMLEVAGHSVAMKNASQKALAAADEQTGSNDEDGVANWILMHLKK